jgi:hypothetical protein
MHASACPCATRCTAEIDLSGKHRSRRSTARESLGSIHGGRACPR